MGGAPTAVTVRPGVQFVQGAADSFRRLEARLGRQIDVNSTYRDWNTQLKMYNTWNAYVAGKGPYPGHSRAVHPDQSRHTQGAALDSDDWATPGFIPLAAEYGWVRTAANDPTERHHFEYQWWNDKHRNEPVPSGRATAPATPEEEDTMLVLRIDAGTRGTHVCTLGPKTFSHVIKEDNADWVKNVIRADDRYTDITLAQLPTLLRRYGCDLHIWDIRNGQFVVLDPLTGVASSGAVWTAENVIRSAVSQVAVTSNETAEYVKRLAEVNAALSK